MCMEQKGIKSDFTFCRVCNPLDLLTDIDNYANVNVVMDHHDSFPKKVDTDASSSGAMNGFLERMRQLNATEASSLYDLYTKEGGFTEPVEEALDEIVFGIAFDDPEYAANARLLKSGRVRGEEAEAIAASQRAKADEIRKLVIMETGLPTAELISDIEKGQAAVKERLGDTDLTNASSDQLLRTLGILEEDEQGEATFVYPSDLFPESVNEKWDLYVGAVQNHIKISNAVRDGFESREKMGEADKIRRFAHNAIARDLDKILGFDKLPDEEWDFERTRNLVAKMREHKFVGKQTSESIMTSQALARGMGAIGLSVVDRLSKRKK